jgi:hypothetical protein
VWPGQVRVRRDADHAHAVPHEVVDGALVQAGQVDAEHGDIGLAGARGRQQVGHVDAALEDHHAGVVVEGAQRPGLPGGPGRDEQYDDHSGLSCAGGSG